MSRFYTALIRRENARSLTERLERRELDDARDDARQRIAAKGFDHAATPLRAVDDFGPARTWPREWQHPQRHPLFLLRLALERAERAASAMPLRLTDRKPMTATL